MRSGWWPRNHVAEPTRPPAGAGQVYASGVDPLALPMHPTSAPPPPPPPSGGKPLAPAVDRLAAAIERLAKALERMSDA